MAMRQLRSSGIRRPWQPGPLLPDPNARVLPQVDLVTNDPWQVVSRGQAVWLTARRHNPILDGRARPLPVSGPPVPPPGAQAVLLGRTQVDPNLLPFVLRGPLVASGGVPYPSAQALALRAIFDQPASPNNLPHGVTVHGPAVPVPSALFWGLDAPPREWDKAAPRGVTATTPQPPVPGAHALPLGRSLFDPTPTTAPPRGVTIQTPGVPVPSALFWGLDAPPREWNVTAPRRGIGIAAPQRWPEASAAWLRTALMADTVGKAPWILTPSTLPLGAQLIGYTRPGLSSDQALPPRLALIVPRLEMPPGASMAAWLAPRLWVSVGPTLAAQMTLAQITGTFELTAAGATIDLAGVTDTRFFLLAQTGQLTLAAAAATATET